MNVLIIGGSRFAGKQLTLKLAEAGHQLTVVNRGTMPFQYPKNCIHIKLDRNNREELGKIIEQNEFDWVFDMIAMSGKDTEALIRQCLGKIKHFIHISTGSVYNLTDMDRYPTMPVFEEDEIGPISEDEHWYAKEKRICEQHLFDAFKESQFPMTIIRPTFIYGPDNYLYREAYFFDRIQQGLPLYIQEPSHEYFDFIHAADLADLCILASGTEKSLGQAYNATCGETITGEKLAQVVGEIIGKTPQILFYSEKHIKRIDWPEESPLYPYAVGASISFSMYKAQEQLGFRPKFRLTEGLKQTYDWYMSKDSDFLKEKFLAANTTPDIQAKLTRLENLLTK